MVRAGSSSPPRPTPDRRRLRRSRATRHSHVGTLALVLAGLVLAACTGGEQTVHPLPPPPSTAARPPTTPTVDYRGVALPVATGRTTTTAPAMAPGLAKVRGRVVGPDGAAVVGANVRVERLVGGAVAKMDLVSGEDGAWSLPDVLGGAYRIRAWRPPDLAQVDPSFVFVGARETAPVEQKIGRYSGTTPTPAIAPNPPVVGQPAALVVQVTVRSVDAEGVVQGVPVALAAVELAGSTWSVAAPNATTTDADGRVRWEVVCRQVGLQPLLLVVNGVERFQVALPACAEPPAPAPPSSVAPGSPTTRPGVTTTTRPGASPTTARTTTTRPRTP